MRPCNPSKANVRAQPDESLSSETVQVQFQSILPFAWPWHPRLLVEACSNLVVPILMTRNSSACASYLSITFARPNESKEIRSAHGRIKCRSLYRSQTCCNVHGSFRPDRLEMTFGSLHRVCWSFIGPGCGQTRSSLNGRHLPRTNARPAYLSALNEDRPLPAPQHRTVASLTQAVRWGWWEDSAARSNARSSSLLHGHAVIAAMRNVKLF